MKRARTQVLDPDGSSPLVTAKDCLGGIRPDGEQSSDDRRLPFATVGVPVRHLPAIRDQLVFENDPVQYGVRRVELHLRGTDGGSRLKAGAATVPKNRSAWPPASGINWVHAWPRQFAAGREP